MDLELELEQLIEKYDIAIEKLTQLDDETDEDEICLDKQLMAEYESKKEKIEEEISAIAEQIDIIQDKMEAQIMTERRFQTEKEAKGDDYTVCYDCNHFYGDDECNNCEYYTAGDDA